MKKTERKSEGGTYLFEAIKIVKDKILDRGDLTYSTISEQMEYVELLSQFPLGRHLLEHKSFSSYWTDYLMSKSDPEGLEFSKAKSQNVVETFILNNSLLINGWRETFQLFQKLTQTRLEDGICLASIPCGEMRDVLSLDFSNITNFKILGLDIDPSVVSSAKLSTANASFSHNITVGLGDAWNLDYNEEFDLISSCGLNIYEPDRKKVLELYREFFRVLKPNGTLIIGFLTYPPWETEGSEWNLKEVSSQHLLIERILFSDILGLKCQNFRSSDELKNDLLCAGFSDIHFYYDQCNVFPTVTAQKKVEDQILELFSDS